MSWGLTLIYLNRINPGRLPQVDRRVIVRGHSCGDGGGPHHSEKLQRPMTEMQWRRMWAKKSTGGWGVC